MPEPGMLGKAPAVHDPRTLMLRDYLPEALPPPPAEKEWDHGITSWGVMLNDMLGCCVISAMGHAEQLVTANVTTEVTVADGDVLLGYEQVGGYVPGNPATDQGCVELNGLKWWQAHGIGGHKIAAYASCAVANLDDVRDCIALFGFCYIGFQVPASAMDQFRNGQPWDVVPNDGGIVGGHAVILIGYDANSFTVVTWGAITHMSVAFFTKYVDESYGTVSQEWVAASGESPSNLNLQQLLADVQMLQQQPQPTPTPPVPPTPPTPTPPTPQACSALAAPVVQQLQDAFTKQPRSTSARYKLAGAQMVAAALKGQ